MWVKHFRLNSDKEVIVRIVKEVLNLFKIKVGPPIDSFNGKPLPDDDIVYDYQHLSIENEIDEESPVPKVRSVVKVWGPPEETEALETSAKVFSWEAEGHNLEVYRAGVHRLIKLNLYYIFRENFGFPEAPWGIMHGVRPTKIVHRMLADGLNRDEVVARLKSEYEVSDVKATTITDMALRQQPFLAKGDKRTVSVYVGIPFCLSRCLYCSFPANVLPRKPEGIEKFMVALRKDMAAVVEEIKRYDLKVQCIYVGGGTPTSLPDDYFSEMIGLVDKYFHTADTIEFTVEAGRPDSMSPAKIESMVKAGVTRVSVNPQSMQQKTLKRIGRNHTTESIITMYNDLREAGIPEINMDVIIGLPGETVADVADTIDRLLELAPDDLTIHSLALKKGSRLKMNLEEYELPSDEECRAMFDTAMEKVTRAGLLPYYLYRQGYMSGQLENVGCARDGAESMYNIQIMEEHQTILGMGGAASSKVMNWQEMRLKSVFNAKDLVTYIRDIDVYIEKRNELLKEAYDTCFVE